MASGVLERGSPGHFWAWSVLEAVSQTADRDVVRWSGHVFTRDTAPEPRAESLNGLQSPLFVVTRHAEALERLGNGDPEDRKALADATARVAAQSFGMIGPLPDRVELTDQQEADFDAGLGRVWAEQRLTDVWQRSESAELTGVRDVPSYSRGVDPLASATRDVVAEIARQQGREPSAADFARIPVQLITEPPDTRWAAVAKMIPGGDQLTPDQSWHVARMKFRQVFVAAVQAGNPGAGTPDSPASSAVRQLAIDIQKFTRTPADGIDARLATLAHDPALASPGRPARTTADGPDRATDQDTGQDPAHAAAGRDANAPDAAVKPQRRGFLRIRGFGG